jgi:hypothetical protein
MITQLQERFYHLAAVRFLHAHFDGADLHDLQRTILKYCLKESRSPHKVCVHFTVVGAGVRAYAAVVARVVLFCLVCRQRFTFSVFIVRVLTCVLVLSLTHSLSSGSASQ